MRFYQGLLPRIIWDPVSEKPLVEFERKDERGAVCFDTEDEKIIKLLRKKGYPTYTDLKELEITGQLPHGGFEKMTGALPSGRPAIEEEGTGVPIAHDAGFDSDVTEEEALAASAQKSPGRKIKRRKKKK
jgi:hypothetical protein